MIAIGWLFIVIVADTDCVIFGDYIIEHYIVIIIDCDGYYHCCYYDIGTLLFIDCYCCDIDVIVPLLLLLCYSGDVIIVIYV